MPLWVLMLLLAVAQRVQVRTSLLQRLDGRFAQRGGHPFVT